ncbi:hypothetical protein IEE94_08310 [Yimella sp. cx-573]|nr:hypothetical protein [Yimella sp. cx-573]
MIGWTHQPTFKRGLATVAESRDVTVDGRSYTFVRAGEGDFRIVKIDLQGRFEYLDYVDGDAFLSTFRYGHRPWITVTGRALRHEAVEVLAS